MDRLARGEDAEAVSGPLAERFNRMTTEIRDRERRMAHLALHDPETGLGNRVSLDQAFAGLSSSLDAPLYLAVFGLDRFGHMRSAVGHALAAQVIRQVGERLTALEPGGAAARLSADTLGLAFAAENDADAERRIQVLLNDLERPVQLGIDKVDVALTVGFAPAGEDLTRAVEWASIGLDQARSTRRKLALYDPEAHGDPAANLALMSGMLWAIRSGEIELFYQPKYDLRARTVNAVEGLVRWRHPSRGLLSPGLFIPMAEETGHIRTLTDWVLRQAIADQAAMARVGHEIEVSVNISGRLLGDRDFADFVDRTVKDAVGRLSFEITEAAVIENPDLALEVLDRFRAAGVSISIDDFGVGLSSLAYLKRIPGEELKIDASLIDPITESQRDALIVRSSIDLAHGLGLKVTAEGVETANAFQLLTAMGCDRIQGYLVAKPQPLNELLIFLREDGARRGYG